MARSGEDGLTALDYDMVIMFALNAYNRAMGNEALVFEEFDVH
jgi:ABC-type iron transport system FetAB permease component